MGSQALGGYPYRVDLRGHRTLVTIALVRLAGVLCQVRWGARVRERPVGSCGDRPCPFIRRIDSLVPHREFLMIHMVSGGHRGGAGSQPPAFRLNWLA